MLSISLNLVSVDFLEAAEPSPNPFKLEEDEEAVALDLEEAAIFFRCLGLLFREEAPWLSVELFL